MKPEIEKAIQEICVSFDCHVDVQPDSEGGAFVKVPNLDIGSHYEPERSWVAFRITFQYPFADVYPHFLVPHLRRKDGKDLTSPLHPQNQFWEPPSGREAAVMLSRRSNRRDAAVDTAALKLQRVLEWLRSQQ
ncbi:hypothetical protein [Prosthecobacter sp.]|uniref:hypothetical protein n=1 Tax=Prosthecobacter sp. TaxID=1965333 RepID=UPI001D71498D|nr:hypothetical protein [Prosthecobacter sp.]MCB1276782.1 hypothetical protein [Prosthecobacter sp.]